MKRMLRRLGLTLLVAAALFVVLRAIVVPLARQRQGRRELPPTALSLIPANTERWVLRRGLPSRSLRSLWPDGASVFPRRLNEWDLPMDGILADLSLSRIRGGTWLGGTCSSGGWFLIGPRSRLPRGGSLAKAIESAPDTSLQCAHGILMRRGSYFTLASDAGVLDGPGWLDELPEWMEIGDLLVGADWLEFRRCEEGGALLGAKPLLGVLHCEGLAWRCETGLDALAGLAPGPAAVQPAAAGTLDSIPTLRHSAPFGPNGRPLAEGAALLSEEAGLVTAERRWFRNGFAATERVVSRPRIPGAGAENEH